jgi:UDP-GlcNAc:undecaprenyl-phosphate GlcNAc-1-phosphate transferase
MYMFIDLIFVFFFSLCMLYSLSKVAPALGLVDTPNLRKQHQGRIPLVGGIAVSLALLTYFIHSPNILAHADLFVLCITVLVILGAIDDRFDMPVAPRLLVQAGITILVIANTHMQLDYVGNIFGFGDMHFGPLAPIITILAVIGAINAFNMVDGIDGLLGGLAIITFTGMAIVLNLHALHNLAFVCLVVVAALVPYVMFNLGILGHKRKVFMGDAGSMMIGFVVIWFLLTMTQPDASATMRPVTALWLIGLPLMDMTAIMFRRIKRGQSPFTPDRDHLHHICLNAGIGKTGTLFVICSLAAVFACFGIIGEYIMLPESIMFISFLFTFAVYTYALKKNWPHHIAQTVLNNSPSTLSSIRAVRSPSSTSSSSSVTDEVAKKG